MTLEVIGAGLGRTGTNSLKLALERLLDAPCYHMFDLYKHPEHVPIWEQALHGRAADWDRLFSGYRAAIDWTAASFFSELAAAYPDAIVLLSVRGAHEWWRSADDTVFEALQTDPGDDPWAKALAPTREFTLRMLNTRFTPRWADEAAAKEAYARHNAAVRESIPARRLVEWRPGDGWGPICEALELPVPEEPFPHVNTTADFRASFGLDATP
jgi:Sulfotransferase domain